MKSKRVILIAAASLTWGCNTFGTPPEFQSVDSVADGGGSDPMTGDPTTGDADGVSDAAALDAATDAADSGPTDAGNGLPTVVIEDTCDASIKTWELANPLTGNFLHDIALVHLSVDGTHLLDVSYLDGAGGEARKQRLIYSAPNDPGLSSFAQSSLESLSDVVPADFRASGATVAPGSSPDEFLWAFTGVNCATMDEAERLKAVWYGARSPGEIDSSKSLTEGACPLPPPGSSVDAPAFTGGWSPFLQRQDFAPYLSFTYALGLASVAVQSADQALKTQWEFPPFGNVASASSTAGELLMTLDADSSLFVWDPSRNGLPIAVPDIEDGSKGLSNIGLGADMIYLGNRRYLVAYKKRGIVALDLFVYRPDTREFRFFSNIDKFEPFDPIVAVELAPFEGGWVLGWIESGAGRIQKTQIPYSMEGQTITRFGCSSVNGAPLRFINDAESIAYIEDGTLVATWGVNSILPVGGANVELPTLEMSVTSFEGLFD